MVHNFVGWRVQNQGASPPGVWRGLLSALLMVPCCCNLPCPFYKAWIPILNAELSWPNHLTKASSHGRFALGVTFQHMNLGGMDIKMQILTQEFTASVVPDPSQTYILWTIWLIAKTSEGFRQNSDIIAFCLRRLEQWIFEATMARTDTGKTVREQMH